MPAPCPAIRPEAEELVCAWARGLRALRQELKVSTRETAEAAGLSRVTLHRIERGNPSVTVGAYAAVDAARTRAAGHCRRHDRAGVLGHRDERPAS